MANRVYKAIERALFQCWNQRLPGVQSRAKREDRAGSTAGDAYLKGYRQAYFDAVADMVEGGLVQEDAVVTLNEGVNLESDEVH